MKKALKTYNFDWDDNILFMPTKIVLFHKQTDEECLLTTEEYAHHRQEVGKSGIYQDFQVIRQDDRSYREFRDDPENRRNIFKDAVMEGVNNKQFGPSWSAFCKALENTYTAEKVSIITARGHSPEQMEEALIWLQAEGYIRHLPLLTNIFPVSYPFLDPAIRGDAATPEEAKKKILAYLLDQAVAENVLESGFSDDDAGTIKVMKQFFKENLYRWPGLKLSIFYTGKNPECTTLSQQAKAA